MTAGVAVFGARPKSQPLAEATVNLVVCRVPMRPAEILTHQRQSCLEQVERRPKGIPRGGWARTHASLYGMVFRDLWAAARRWLAAKAASATGPDHLSQSQGISAGGGNVASGHCPFRKASIGSP